MNRHFLKLTLPTVFAVCVTQTSTPQPPRSENPADATISGLIKQLSSPDEAIHKAAAAKLEVMPEAIPALLKAVESTDYGLYRRARAVLREALLRKIRRIGDDGPIDLFVERMLRADNAFEEEAFFRVTAEIAGKVLDREKREFNRVQLFAVETMPVYDYDRFQQTRPTLVVHPSEVLKDNAFSFVARRESIEFLGGKTCLLVTPGSVRTRSLNRSVIVTGDSVAAKFLETSIVISDGDVSARGFLRCIVLSRGSVKCEIDFEKSVVLATGAVEFGKNRINAGSVIKANEPKLLGWVRFFEITDAGLEVAKADGGVRVRKATARQPPAKAGVKVGDVIAAIDHTKISDPEQFRRLLRKSTTADSTKFTVLRDGKSVDLIASFVGWEPPPTPKADQK